MIEMKILIFIFAIIIGIVLIDKLCLWLEENGLLYYRHSFKGRKGAFLGNALMELSLLFQPNVRYTKEVKQSQVQFKRTEADVPSDDYKG